MHLKQRLERFAGLKPVLPKRVQVRATELRRVGVSCAEQIGAGTGLLGERGPGRSRGGTRGEGGADPSPVCRDRSAGMAQHCTREAQAGHWEGFLYSRVVRHCNKLLRGAAHAPGLSVFKGMWTML